MRKELARRRPSLDYSQYSVSPIYSDSIPGSPPVPLDAPSNKASRHRLRRARRPNNLLSSEVLYSLPQLAEKCRIYGVGGVTTRTRGGGGHVGLAGVNGNKNTGKNSHQPGSGSSGTGNSFVERRSNANPNEFKVSSEFGSLRVKPLTKRGNELDHF